MSKKETIKPWLPKCDLEDFGLFLYEYNNAEYGTLNWGKPSFVDFCKRNNIQQKGTKKKINPNRSLEKASCHFLMTAIRKTALYMLD